MGDFHHPRLELTPKGTRKPVLFAAQESPDDMSDSGGGIRKRPGCGMTRSKDPGLERFVRLGRTTFGRICGLVFLIIERMADEQKENRRIVTLKWWVAE